MAVDMFLKLTGVDGESKDKTYGKQIDILAWSWGCSNAGSGHAGGGSGAGKVNVQDISVTKWVDSSSPSLLLACCNGDHYDEGNLIIRKAGGSSPVEYLKIKLTEVFVTSISTGGSGGEDRLTENVSLNFSKFQLFYTPQDAKGAAGTPIPCGWDISANAKA
jgi:type VI secretion system secreted protein Hcp